MEKDNCLIVDSLGCVHFPPKLLEFLGVKPKDTLIFSVNDSDKSLLLKKNNSKKENIEKWVNEIMGEIDNTCKDNSVIVDFTQYGRVTSCIVIDEFDNVMNGISICSPKDKFNWKIGECISFSRAMEYDIPDFILKSE